MPPRQEKRPGQDSSNSSNTSSREGGRERRGRGERGDKAKKPRDEREELEERVVHIARTAKVVKGGRRFAFRAVVVVGDKKGRVGIGIGKAREVPDAIRKAGDRARKLMIKVPMLGSTIPHTVEAKFGAGQVLLKPASPGTGVIAGGGVRAVIEAAGITDVLSKSLGSSNILNVAQATFSALQSLQDYRQLAQLRGVDVKRVTPFWYREEMQNG